jgi:hypothetical protein
LFGGVELKKGRFLPVSGESRPFFRRDSPRFEETRWFSKTIVSRELTHFVGAKLKRHPDEQYKLLKKILLLGDYFLSRIVICD